jgi:hypothetical protein
MSRPMTIAGVAKVGVFVFGIAFVIAALAPGSSREESLRPVSAADLADGGPSGRAPSPAVSLRTSVPVPPDAVLDGLRPRGSAPSVEIAAPAPTVAETATPTATATATAVASATPTPVPAPVQEAAPVEPARPITPPSAPEAPEGGSFDRSAAGSGEFDLPDEGP